MRDERFLIGLLQLRLATAVQVRVVSRIGSIVTTILILSDISGLFEISGACGRKASTSNVAKMIAV